MEGTWSFWQTQDHGKNVWPKLILEIRWQSKEQLRDLQATGKLRSPPACPTTRCWIGDSYFRFFRRCSTSWVKPRGEDRYGVGEQQQGDGVKHVDVTQPLSAEGMPAER